MVDVEDKLEILHTYYVSKISYRNTWWVYFRLTCCYE